ncbi:methanol dehydrogenase, NAD-dependent, partial [Pseudomonas syringae pv. actinidiae ICMP 18804]
MHSNDWHYPTSIRAGAGRVRELADACRVTGIKRPLLITDSFLGSTDMIDSAVEDCRRQLGHC